MPYLAGKDQGHCSLGELTRRIWDAFGTVLGQKLLALYRRVLAFRRLKQTSVDTGGSISLVVYSMPTLR
jgi:hypothetical protein